METKERYSIKLEIDDLITNDDMVCIKDFVHNTRKKDPLYSLQKFVTEAVFKYAIDLNIIDADIEE
jgi:tetrahydromethanopterin S-methyltransferase subunit A